MKAGLGSADGSAWGGPAQERGGPAVRAQSAGFLLRANGGHGRPDRKRRTGHFQMPAFRTSHRRGLRGVLSEARLPECILRHVCLLVCQVLLPSSSTQRTGGALSRRSEKQASPSLPESTRGHPQGPQGSLRWRSPHRRRDGGWLRNESERWEEG